MSRIVKAVGYLLFLFSGLEQEESLLPLFFSFALQYAVWKVQENQERLALNGKYQYQIYADDITCWVKTCAK
jgi:hypothetical protein